MRVAFITVGDPARLTGGYLYHARVFAGLRARGIDVTQIVAAAAPLEDQLAAAAAFGAAFDPRPYDVVVVDALARGVCAPWLDGWRALRPLVAMVHELPSVAIGGHAKVFPDLALETPLLRADLLIAVSGHGRALLEERGAPAARIRVVAPGCDRLEKDEGEGMRHEAGGHESVHPSSPIPHPSPLRVLCVAQWIPRKGIVELVQAWASRPRPGALLELIGEPGADPAYARAVHAAIAAAPLASPLVVHGPVDDAALAAAYRRAAVFALPSRYEGYGMVYAEALRHGLPVLACAVGPVPELLGAAGITVPPEDPAALAAALGLLLGDGALRACLAREASARAASLPTWDDTTRGFLAVLAEAKGRGPQAWFKGA